MKKVLYISYDGMTDPLGQSQVLPYLIKLSNLGYQFTILSCEKHDRMLSYSNVIQSLTVKSNIKWVTLPFTSKPRYLAKVLDVFRLRHKALELSRQYKYDLIHCRSYVGAGIGLYLKKKLGINFIFDMRGLWADEKKDVGAWNEHNLLFGWLYRYYKHQEIVYLKHAFHIITLTEAAKKEIASWDSYDKNVPISVIPCCADMEHFSLTNPEQRIASRKLLELPEDRLVVSYLGSLGTWYMLDEMLELFCCIKSRYPECIFLFVTPSDPQMVLKLLDKHNIKNSEVKIMSATRNEVPVFIKASDINISFIKPVYSKIASSPVKFAEVLAMGIPTICNYGIGDVELMVKDNPNAVIAVRNFSLNEYSNIVEQIPGLLKCSAQVVRNSVKESYSLDSGVAKYLNIYKSFD